MIRIAKQVFHIVDRIAMASVHTGSQSIDRAAQLLVAVAESSDGLSVGELVERTDLPKSTVSRLVAALERNALVQRESARGPLRPGPVLMRLAGRGVPDRTLIELAGPALRRLADESQETINLAVPTALGVDHLSQIDSPHFLGSTNWIGRRVPHHCTAVGKLFLAFGAVVLPPGRLPALTSDTVTDPALLERQLERVRADGYAVVVGELEPGLAAVAAPVRAGGGEVLAALSVSGPDARLSPARMRELAAIMLEEARGVSARLGHSTTKRGAA
jgi:IclR family transcriptional regulator, acetate operon repressor